MFRGTQPTMRVINRTLVVDVLREHGALSRAEIVRLTAISTTSVSAIVRELIRDGLVSEGGWRNQDLGRPARLLRLTEQALYVGCDLSSLESMRLGLVSLSGELVETWSINYRSIAPSPEEVVRLLGEYVARALDRHSGCRIGALGVGLPAVADPATGTVTWAPTLGWSEVPFAALATEHIDVRTVVDNDVNLALLAEADRGAASSASHAVLVAFADGVGGALLVDGRLYRGRGRAGELGYMVTDVGSARGEFAAFGFLERSVAATIEQEVVRSGIDVTGLARRPTTLVRRLVTADGTLKLSPSRFEELVSTVSAALASAVAILDPEVVILEGWIELLEATPFLAQVQQELGRLVVEPPPIRFSELRSHGVVIGAALAARNASLEAFHVVHRDGGTVVRTGASLNPFEPAEAGKEISS